ncbi:hypothetical protein VZT92_024166 [Zoarces viviparus]|uniref:DUF3990 domain-containing protein n=1 Tax=Zoarces viviparus TaxID=48416 RepID=A0AAW1E1D9_ZOAVI
MIIRGGPGGTGGGRQGTTIELQRGDSGSLLQTCPPVLDKYEDNTWLGNMNRETESVPGEWPVSYHGTQEQYVKAITEGNYKPGDGKVYGYGVYSTPDIKIAKEYATEFRCKGQKYKVVMQNRINPKYRKKCKIQEDYWLVPIEDTTKMREIVKKAIRPYGLLLIEV